MVLKKRENFELGIRKIKGEPFHWKPIWDGAKSSFFKVENGTDFKWINTWAYYVPTLIRVHWLWFCVYLKVFPKNIGGKTPNRYVELRKTHLEPLNYPYGSWQD